MSTILWTREEFEEANDGIIVDFVRRTDGICAGLSYSWLQGILKDGKPYNSMPDIRMGIYFQHIFGAAQILPRYPEYTDLESISWYQTGDHIEPFENVWSYPSFIQGQSVGIWIALIPETGNGHAAALKSFGDVGYLMLPNTGLISCDSLESLIHYVFAEKAFRELEFRVSYVHIHRVKCPAKLRRKQVIVDLTLESP